MTPKFTHSSENDGLIVTGEIFDTPLAKSDVAIIYARISIHNKDNNHLINTFYVPSITEEHMVLEVDNLAKNINLILDGDHKRK